MTDRIDPAAEARKHIGWTHDWQEREGDTGEAGLATAMIAQAEATLALVEQQRVTNLMAYHGDFYHEHQEELLERYPEIAAALGIEVQP